MSLSTAEALNALVASHTSDVRHSCPRLHVAAASSGSGSLYSGWGGASHVPALDAPLESAPPLAKDDIFMMASATKLVTTVAVLQLVERGVVGMGEDVRELLPELAAVKRLDGFDEKGEPILIENNLPITVKMLLTHTAVS